MALSRTDRLLGGYVVATTCVLLARGAFDRPATWWVLAMHGLFFVLLCLFSRLGPEDRYGLWIHDWYPLLMLLPFYGAIGILNLELGRSVALANDTIVQQWEATLFGGQVSYDWIRQHPSVFWSGVFHASYFGYYLIIVLGPAVLALQGRRREARGVLFSMMVAFVLCYIVFITFPVGGPYYAFEHPTGPTRAVWSAELVYGVLAAGSSFGAAFPSSHVAATIATTASIGVYAPRVAAWFIPPAILLTVGTVYCQMHYGVDAASGVLVGGIATWVGVAIGRGERGTSAHASGGGPYLTAAGIGEG